jgi:hypothetical protein
MEDVLVFSCPEQSEAAAHAARYANYLRAHQPKDECEVVVKQSLDGAAWGVYRRETPA